jgi:deoxyxylulose-5-phosphate synthase
MKTKKHFRATGLVYGNYWGGGQGSYPARKLEGKSLKAIERKAIQMLEDGSLDSGMGYESLTCALFDIEIVITVVVDGLEYTRSEYDFLTIGNMTEEISEFLEEQMLYA